jgi:hypothetical protein
VGEGQLATVRGSEVLLRVFCVLQFPSICVVPREPPFHCRPLAAGPVVSLSSPSGVFSAVLVLPQDSSEVSQGALAIARYICWGRRSGSEIDARQSGQTPKKKQLFRACLKRHVSRPFRSPVPLPRCGAGDDDGVQFEVWLLMVRCGEYG